PEIAFTLTNNGRETLRVAPAKDLRDRAYQIFGAQFLDSLLEVNNAISEPTETSFSLPQIAKVQGFVSAPRERRTSRDGQFLFVNGRFVRDRLIGRALSEGYRSILPHGVYPIALLFIDVPLEEVDVNVHPAKTEVRFRRAAAVADSVREAVRSGLASAGYAPAADIRDTAPSPDQGGVESDVRSSETSETSDASTAPARTFELQPQPQQERIAFATARAEAPPVASDFSSPASAGAATTAATPARVQAEETFTEVDFSRAAGDIKAFPDLPPLDSAIKFVREVPVESVSANIRPLGQLDESFIIATDEEGLLLIDQHVAHERVLFDKYRALEASRRAESQQMLIPETFDLTPAQAAAFDAAAEELEAYGFSLMRLSGRTVAIKSTPADLPASEARNVLSEVFDTVDAEKRGAARATLRDEIAASLACHAAIKVNMPLAPEKMRWLIDRLLLTSSPTTCPHGRPVILRLATQDILKGFHRI
ncbi:MAG TPA: DNA mismatch repair endonuclease MutL, partial [Pyrinomonadaceae bacterium]|nr:DNA mismatch repair endonuclease MutL [Pyrinomonadaceae bacterium]